MQKTQKKKRNLRTSILRSHFSSISVLRSHVFLPSLHRFAERKGDTNCRFITQRCLGEWKCKRNRNCKCQQFAPNKSIEQLLFVFSFQPLHHCYREFRYLHTRFLLRFPLQERFPSAWSSHHAGSFIRK